jgi:plastocyanin
MSAIVAVSCSDDGGSTSKTSVGTSTPSGSATTPGAGGGAISTVTAAVASASTLQISASGTKFDTDKLNAKAGRVTVQFTNNDNGMTHSFALYRSNSDLDQPLAATTIATGPNVMSVTADLTPGDYYFQCQVHPQQMNGTLTASP